MFKGLEAKKAFKKGLFRPFLSQFWAVDDALQRRVGLMYHK